MPPGARIDRVVGERRLRGIDGRFSRMAICPVFRQPKAATARSVLPSPLKSAASTSATRGQPSSQNAPNLPSPSPRSQMTAPSW